MKITEQSKITVFQLMLELFRVVNVSLTLKYFSEFYDNVHNVHAYSFFNKSIHIPTTWAIN